MVVLLSSLLLTFGVFDVDAIGGHPAFLLSVDASPPVVLEQCAASLLLMWLFLSCQTICLMSSKKRCLCPT